ncbi:putative purine nucleoside phosphorylase [Erysiphe necator]|uniref:purine-nucleoside phosphorylase n=1 Tax=Uncinula necator TaxID=52586 RepID=A0A0B1P227_UNCNE|nr:putative purine nucleoside phosphorylase [Erysiphe necator]
MEIPSSSPLTGQSQVLATALHIRSLLPDWYTPTVAIIGGSGLSALEGTISSLDPPPGKDLASEQKRRLEVKFNELVGFPIPSVSGHVGKLIFGTIATRNGIKIHAVLMSGRAHFYEGNDAKTTTFPVRVFGALNIKVLIVTNAAGGLNRNYRVGDIMVINDHISLPSLSGSFNPLIGPLDESSGTPGNRFLALSDAYDYNLRKAAWQAWKKMSSLRIEEGSCSQTPGVDRARKLQEGIYAMVAGPTYETRTETRFLSAIGADVVGMSTVPEVIVARHIGIRVLGLTLVTNLAVLEMAPRGDAELEGCQNQNYDISAGKANHKEVLEAGKVAADVMRDLIIEILGTDEVLSFL